MHARGRLLRNRYRVYQKRGKGHGKPERGKACGRGGKHPGGKAHKREGKHARVGGDANGREKARER